MDLTNAPISKNHVLQLEDLRSLLQKLVGEPIEITRKVRTDGANIRKMVSDTLIDRVQNALKETEYEILPPKGKGIPRILLELIDTYVVTTGDKYNLQVWNRIPNSTAPLVRYKNGEVITSHDIRLVLIKVDITLKLIESVIILTPQYIEDNFGQFGKPTIKQQLLVSNIERGKIITSQNRIYLSKDTDNIRKHLQKEFIKPSSKSSDIPETGKIFPIEIINDIVCKKLIGLKLIASDTKTRGQLLEREVINLLGYNSESRLVGGYPDVPNQLLEVKVQDTQTIDLGRYSPQFVEIIDEKMALTTEDVRYLIALTDSETQIIEGVILSSGENLGDIFTYVSDKSYKCQRSIPMDFFNTYRGKCIVNP